MTAVVFRGVVYEGRRRCSEWWEAEDRDTGQGVAWSPNRETTIEKARARGYEVEISTTVRFHRVR